MRGARMRGAGAGGGVRGHDERVGARATRGAFGCADGVDSALDASAPAWVAVARGRDRRRSNSRKRRV